MSRGAYMQEELKQIADEMEKCVVNHAGGNYPIIPPYQLLEWASRLRALAEVQATANEALREIAFWTPTICYEQSEQQYIDIEEAFRIKRIAADARSALAVPESAAPTDDERREVLDNLAREAVADGTYDFAESAAPVQQDTRKGTE